MISIRAHAAPWRAGIEFLLTNPGLEQTNGGIWVARPPEFIQVSQELVSEPTMHISFQAAQVLVDDLWAAGLRPTEGAGSAGSLAATQRHLEDMRQLLFSKLKVQKPV